MSGGGTALLGEAVPSDTAIVDLVMRIVNGEWRVRGLSHNGRGWEGYRLSLEAQLQRGAPGSAGAPMESGNGI